MSTTASGNGPVSTSTDVPELWVYPPGGADIPPVAQTGNFGPVHLHDWVVLQWAPDTKPKITLACFTESGLADSYDLATSAVSPLALQLNTIMNRKNIGETNFCHFDFPNSKHGNTVTFPFVNKADSDGVVTWSAPASVATPASSTIQSFSSQIAASTSLGATAIATSNSHSSSSNKPTNKPSSDGSGAKSDSLSTGAKAGIGVGVALGVIIICILLGIIFWQRRKHRKQPLSEENTGPSSAPLMQENASHYAAQSPPAPVELPSNPVFVDPTKEPPSELKGNEVAKELPTNWNKQAS